MLCPQCNSTDVDRLDGTLVCTNCGHVLGESEIVNDVTFGETSAGAATVQGTQVNASGRHSMIGPGGRRYGDGDGRAMTMMRADSEIKGLCRRLGIESVQVHQMATRIFQLALNIGQGATPFLHPDTNEVSNEGGSLVQGRKSEYSYGACVYLALRRVKVPIMLIEVADAVRVNVFVLGRAYLRLTSLLRFDPDQRDLSLADPSMYIRRFAKMLDFGDAEDKVILDATRLCTRFKHDWLVQGRRPSGITGACLLIAARMNNFRRSVAEVVQVVKVADTTLKRRLDEFRETKAGSMSIAEFRDMWDSPAEQDVLPPSAMRNRKREAEAAQKKQERIQAGEEVSDDGAFDGEHESEEEPAQPAPSDQLEQAAEADQEMPPPPPAPAPPASVPAPAPLPPETNPELEDDVDGAIAGEVQEFLDSNLLRNDYDSAIQAQNASERRARMTAAERAAEAQVAPVAITQPGSSQLTQATQVASGPSQMVAPSQATVVASQVTSSASPKASRPRPHSVEPSGRPHKRRRKSHRKYEEDGDPLAGLDEDELDGYLLDDEEQEIKERIWTEFNKDFLQQALVKALKEEEDLKRGIAPSRGTRRRRVVRDTANATGTSAADAATKMVQARRFSQKINYAVLGNMFTGTEQGEKKGKHRAHEADQGDDGDEAEEEISAALDYVDDDGEEAPPPEPHEGSRRRSSKHKSRRRSHRSSGGGEVEHEVPEEA